MGTYFHKSGEMSFRISTTQFCTNGLNSLSILVIHHNAISESNLQTHVSIFRDGTSALLMLVSNLANTSADNSSNLGVVAPVMGDTLVFEATSLHTTEFHDCILRLWKCLESSVQMSSICQLRNLKCFEMLCPATMISTASVLLHPIECPNQLLSCKSLETVF